MNASQQSQINISLIFNHLRDNGSANRSRIAADLGLSIPAVSRSIDLLESKGFIIRDVEDSTPARKGTPVYQTNTEFGFVVAIDIFSTRAEAVIVDFSGQIRCRVNGFNPDKSRNIAQDLTAMIDKCIDDFNSVSSGNKEKIRAIGLGVPAVVDRKTGSLTLSYFSEYENIDFIGLLEKRYKLPIFMENISSLSAFAEKIFGKRDPRISLVFLEIGPGIGSGILLDGNVYRGKGFAGEIGFSLTNGDETILPDQRIGPLEKKASLSALKYNVLRELSLGAESSLKQFFTDDRELISPLLIFEHALKGDLLCLQMISDLVHHLSIALHNMAIIIHPEAIIIGGDVFILPGMDQLLLAPIRENLRKTLPFNIPEISFSSLGNKSGILGAAAMAIDSLLTEEFPYRKKNWTI